MARFEGYGPEAYRKKNSNKPIEDLTEQQVGNKGTEAPDPASLKNEKSLTKKQKARLKEYDEQ